MIEHKGCRWNSISPTEQAYQLRVEQLADKIEEWLRGFVYIDPQKQQDVEDFLDRWVMNFVGLETQEQKQSDEIEAPEAHEVESVIDNDTDPFDADAVRREAERIAVSLLEIRRNTSSCKDKDLPEAE